MSLKNFVFEKVVYLSDTNAEGNVYFAKYYEWQGHAREEFYRRFFPVDIWKSGLKLITVNASMDYKKETFLYDEVSIEVKIANIKHMSLELLFRYINKKNDALIALGKQCIAFADSAGKLIEIPPQIKAIASDFVDAVKAPALK